MIRTHYASEIKDNEKVTLAGWVHELRNVGNILFVILRDSSGVAQITVKKDAGWLFEEFVRLRKESVIAVTGTAKMSEKGRKIEVIPESVDVLSEVHGVLPIDMVSKDVATTLEKRLDARCLDLRKPENQAIFRVQSMLVYEMTSFLNKEGFMQVFTPCIMGTASESGAEVFEIGYFDRKAYLRQDPQLHRQLAIAGGLEKIYDVGPCWRAEQSHTTRHLCEHRVIAAEMAFIKDEYDVIELEQNMVISAMQKIKKDCKAELEIFGVDVSLPKKFPVLEFPAVYDTLRELGLKIKHGEDYGTEGERLLGEYVREKYKSDFFFVNKFPFAVKPFYVMRDDEWARSTDLVYNGVEMSSGGQREHRYEKIIEQAKIKGIKPQSVSWFSDFFKYGVPPHGGFAIGIERLTMMLLDVINVRECALFPRDTTRLTP